MAALATAPCALQAEDFRVELSAPAAKEAPYEGRVILVLAANTAFNGFPVLGSILARDGFLPRQLATKGDRLTLTRLKQPGSASAASGAFSK